MPILQIDGVGRVEVDNSFLEMSPAEQEATINEITASARKSAPAPKAAAPGAAAPEAPAPEASGPYETPADQWTPLNSDAAPGASSNTFDDAWLAEQEAQYQNSLAGGANPGAPKAPAGPEKFNEFASAGLGFLDSVSFGTSDEIGAGIDAIAPWGKKNIWQGDSLKDAYSSNVEDNRTRMEEASAEDPGSFFAGSLGGALVPGVGIAKGFSAGTSAVKALSKGAGKLTGKQTAAAGAIDGAAAGGIYGFGSGENSLGNRLETAGTYAAGGALGGAVVGGGIHAAKGLSKNVRAERFADKQIKDNPFAAFDAEIVEDLAAATRDRAVSKTDPKGRAALTAKTINNIEQQYRARFPTLIQKLDIEPVAKERLKEALEGRYSLKKTEIDALRGTEEGNAVADAVIKVQRLRALTPELKRSATIMTKLANGMDFVPGIPGIAGRGLRAMARAAGDGEAARVNAADKLLGKEAKYAKLLEMTGPSGQRESSEALWRKVAAQDEAQLASAEAEALASAKLKMLKDIEPKAAERKAFRQDIANPTPEPRDIKAPALTDKQLASRIANREAAILKMEGGLNEFDDKLAAPPPPVKEKPVTQKDLKALRQQITDPTPDPRDLRNPAPSEAQLAQRIRSRDSAISKMEAGLSQFDDKLATPLPAPKAPKPKQLPPEQAAIEDNIAKGIQGSSGTQTAFATRLGVTNKEMLATLDQLEAELPDLAGEINRIRFNYPTQNKKLGSVLAPRMRAILDSQPKAPGNASAAPATTAAKAGEAPAVYRTPEVAQPELVPGGPLAAEVSSGRSPDWKSTDPDITPAQREFAQAHEDWVSAEDDFSGELFNRKEAAAAKLDEELYRRSQEPEMRGIDRPLQWEQGKSRYQTLANEAITDLKDDIRLTDDTLRLLKRVPEQIRDQFKTVEEAQNFIETTIMDDLIGSNVGPDEIRLVREHLYGIAQHKPYYDQAALKAGTKSRPRGRPRKNAEEE